MIPHTYLCIGYHKPNQVSEPMYLTFISLSFCRKNDWHASVHINLDSKLKRYVPEPELNRSPRTLCSAS
jgi:hypothetical protein